MQHESPGLFFCFEQGADDIKNEMGCAGKLAAAFGICLLLQYYIFPSGPKILASSITILVSYARKIFPCLIVGTLILQKAKMYKLAEEVGSVFQNPKSQFFNIDSNSEITFGLENAGVAPSKMKERFDATVSSLKIQSLLDLSYPLNLIAIVMKYEFSRPIMNEMILGHMQYGYYE